ncbi:uncharacterized protein FOMMEDRAFT_149443 [Fomitiporia mediterranea MF3/22]|uniref:uncharacterized protein n=1 Tax=Fomitiporia mediterranea (strain MF3/22) TaxID=694068 RepID=UPI0004408961|nr:uncharacterized protein FOMMEDRAFT_149443 [Fomitiporia mediterranea MF3/22]EJC97998.1 hypothetical protein FOMMEDRAFT_149443 [Fomitiporia mediterranea MF3/22]
MALQVAVDRGYLNLLAQLRQSSPSVSTETLQAAICHYLVHLPSTQPTPTPLTASILASPVWHPLSLASCLSLGNTFRVAIRQNYIELKKKKRGFFDPSVTRDLATWIRGILNGLNNGDALLRLAISGGLFLGIKDLRDDKVEQRLSRIVEEVIVLAFADLTEGTAAAKDPWTSEFKQNDAHSSELPVLLASQYFNWISTEALSALNLINLASSCLAAIEKAFMSGTYLLSSLDSLIRDDSGSIILSEGSNLERDIDALLISESFTCVAYLCRLVARVIMILSDTLFRTRKKRELWDLLNGITQRLQDMACRVEEDWRSSLLAQVQAKNDLGNKVPKLTEKIWNALKTQLFSTLMLQQAVLDTILFHPPPPSPSTASNTYSPSHLTSTILNTLSSLSFIIASFGGVTAGSSTGAKGPTFPELKKVFYISIDILSTNVLESESFVRNLVRDTNVSCGGDSISGGGPFANAKRSFTLACIEQFIPVLDDHCIEEVILPFCEPHLGDPSERQTYESAHSVMLSIFAAHADKSADTSSSAEHEQSRREKGTVDLKGKTPAEKVGLARRLVPGYAQCLLENAKEGGLTTPQLRLAYAALVRSASTGRHSHPTSPSPHNFTRTSTDERPTWGVQSAWQWLRGSPDRREEDFAFAGDPALAWLCIEQLLQALSLAAPNPDQHFALSLTLISLISSTHPAPLPRLLKEIQQLIDTSYGDDQTDGERRRVLIESVFEEVMEKVGDAEREVVMQWWFECSRKWGEEGMSASASASRNRVEDGRESKQRSML